MYIVLSSDTKNLFLMPVGMHKLAETAWLDTGHKFGALFICILLWNDWISHADLDEWNCENQSGAI